MKKGKKLPNFIIFDRINDPNYDSTNYEFHRANKNNSGNCNELLDDEDDDPYYGQDHPNKPPG